MDKRYWFIVVSINNKNRTGKMNAGFISDKDNPFSNEAIKKGIVKTDFEIDIKDLVIENFIEFKSEEDFINFWKLNDVH